ncbi:myelin transcription factor 1-like protein [Helianthus annuus]|uniref:myelin transcription factor 1-like protein n=1 Tax=Helianthus annuus TaxID=4232 RepID=UPI000B8F92D7|nr:myelin transcription factor 1-like protein [Helianthus annuus]
MQDKGKSVESSVNAERSIILATDPESPIQNPVPISSVSAIFEEDVSLEDIAGNDDEEDDEEDNDEEDDNEEGDDEEDDDEEKVFLASSHSSDDDNDDDDNQAGTGVSTTEASNEKNVDDLMNDDANEVSEGADGEGEHVDDQNVDQVEKLILQIESHVEEGEFRHTYTLNEILKMFNVNEDEFTFDFEEELNVFDINHQPEYEYKYVEDADVYDRVKIEDCTDEESLNEDTSEFPTLMEFFSEENMDELRRKVTEMLKDKNFDGTIKDPQKEERKKWFKDSHERKFKRRLKFYQRYRKELSKVRTLGYPVRKNDVVMWGLIKFEALKNFKHWKPHYPKKVRRVNPETGDVETILNVKRPKAMKNIPVPKMEQEFYKGFMGWVYSCISTEAVIIYRAG